MTTCKGRPLGRPLSLSQLQPLLTRHLPRDTRRIPQTGQQHQRDRHRGHHDEGLQRIDAAIAHRDQDRRHDTHDQAPEHTHAAWRIVVPTHHHRDGVGHRIPGRGHEQRRQNQEQHRHDEAERQLLSDGDQGRRQIEAAERARDAARVFQLEGQAAAAENGEPDTGRERRQDGYQQHHLTQGAPPRDTRNQHRHQRTEADEPAPEEQRPAIQPAAVAAEDRHRHDIVQVVDHAQREGLEQEFGRPEEHDEEQHRAADQHIGTAQELDAAHHATDGGQGVDEGQDGQQHQLRRVGIGNAEQRIEPVTDLDTEETDRPHGARDDGQYAAGIDQRADRPTHHAFSEQRIEQGARLERQALLIVQVHEDDARQTAQHRPAEKAPVHETLRQRIVGRIEIADRRLRPEDGRRRGEVRDGLSGGPEHATTGQQGAQNGRHPARRGDVRRRQSAQDHAPRAPEGHADGDEEGHDHQALPIGTEVGGREVEGVIDQGRHAVQVDERGGDEQRHHASTEEEDRPVQTAGAVERGELGIRKCCALIRRGCGVISKRCGVIGKGSYLGCGAGQDSPGGIRH